MVNIDKLREYNEETKINGIMMPDINSFDTKVEMPITLWTQKMCLVE